jgi:raffinose/stachyose/melibiose transport system permease protein
LKGAVSLLRTNPNRLEIGRKNGMKSPYSLYLVMPALIVYTVLFVLPAAVGIVMSFFNAKSFTLSKWTFAGWTNYQNVFEDPYINVAITNTLTFSIVTTIGKMVLGMSLALFVNKKFRGTQYMRTVFFLPAVLSNVAVGLVFRSMMHPNGLINQALLAVGLESMKQNWLTDPNIAIFSCAFVEIWKWSGYTMVIFLAGLQSIDTTYYEAAEIDGASPWQRFCNITMPLIMPAFNNALVINIVGGLKVFDLVQTLTKGGPGSATSVFGTLIFSSFSNGNYGRGCAASVILTIFVILIAVPTNQFISKKEVEA